MMFNTPQVTALHKTLRDLGHLLAAAAVLAYLADVLTATPAGIFLTTAFLMIGVPLKYAEDKQAHLLDDLREFRKLHLGAILLAWATNGISMDLGFYIMIFLAAASFVFEWALLADH